MINSLAPGRYGNNFKSMIFKHIVSKNNLCTRCENIKESWYREVNIGSGNGLLPPGNKPLPAPMLT